MIGGLGNDELLGKGGADVLYGDSRNDILAIANSTFSRIDGGPGEDTLRFDGMNMHLDLRTIPELALRNIERSNLNGQANQLTLEVRDLVASSETSNTLIIHGQPGNAVAADLKGSGFSYQGKDPQGYIEYLASNQALRLWVHPDIDRSMIDYDKP